MGRGSAGGCCHVRQGSPPGPPRLIGSATGPLAAPRWWPVPPATGAPGSRASTVPFVPQRPDPRPPPHFLTIISQPRPQALPHERRDPQGRPRITCGECETRTTTSTGSTTTPAAPDHDPAGDRSRRCPGPVRAGAEGLRRGRRRRPWTVNTATTAAAATGGIVVTPNTIAVRPGRRLTPTRGPSRPLDRRPPR